RLSWLAARRPAASASEPALPSRAVPQSSTPRPKTYCAHRPRRKETRWAYSPLGLSYRLSSRSSSNEMPWPHVDQRLRPTPSCAPTSAHAVDLDIRVPCAAVITQRYPNNSSYKTGRATLPKARPRGRCTPNHVIGGRFYLNDLVLQLHCQTAFYLQTGR